MSFRFDIGDELKSDSRHLVVLERMIKPIKRKEGYIERKKWYRVECRNCGWKNYWLTQNNLIKGKSCSCCSGKTVVQSINDIPTTAPWMVKYFQGGYEEAKNYTKFSNKKIRPICPDCGTIKDKPMKIAQLLIQGMGCKCSDGRSYPEKFIAHVLSNVGIDYVSEYTPTWSQGKRYDFYIPSLNMIIEAHGTQHYGNCGRGRTLQEEHENDLLKFDLSVINGVEHYVVINCYKSEFEWIKNSIINSGVLKKLNIDEDTIDWIKCDKDSQKNIVKEVCTYKKNNPLATTTELGRLFKTSSNSIYNMLKKGAVYGWCDYDPRKEKSAVSKRNIKKMGSLGAIKVIVEEGDGEERFFSSITELCEYYKNLGIVIDRNVVTKKIKSKEKYKGFSFKRAPKGGR